MNSPALLHEIARSTPSRARRAAHVLNLSLLPMTPEDHEVLERALLGGARGDHLARLRQLPHHSTRARDVWRVQYFNSMNTLILDTIEIVDMPEVAMAAADDLEDSTERLEELVLDERIAAAEG